MMLEELQGRNYARTAIDCYIQTIEDFARSAFPIVLLGTTADRLMSKSERAGYGRWTESVTGGALVTLALFLLWKA